ncbi:MAG: penicillin-binding transpeptidase domain-containing protein [Oscillospiraceae bacterium]
MLTLDNYVQYTADKYLESAIEEYQIAERGAAVVMNVNTGAILAMSVKGDFDPNEPFTLSSADQKKVSETADEEEKKKLQSELLNRQWRNKAVSDTYEPGSVFKAVTAAIALEENLVNKNSSFFCNGHATVAGSHTTATNDRSRLADPYAGNIEFLQPCVYNDRSASGSRHLFKIFQGLRIYRKNRDRFAGRGLFYLS